MDMDQCLKHAVNFVLGTTAPLFTQLDPEKLGQYGRELAVASEYGKNLLRRYASRRGWDKEYEAAILGKLVYGYPSHAYVIAYRELMEMGFNVNLFSKDESVVVNNLTAAWGDQTVVDLVDLVPEKTSPEKKADPKSET